MQPIIPFLFYFKSFFLSSSELYLKLKKKRKNPVRNRNEIMFVIFIPFHTRKELMSFLLDLYPSGLTGLEPAASALTGRCSDQLNYNPREKSVQHTYSYDFIQTLSFSILDSNRCAVTDRGGAYLYIDIYMDMHFSEINTDYS